MKLSVLYFFRGLTVAMAVAGFCIFSFGLYVGIFSLHVLALAFLNVGFAWFFTESIKLQKVLNECTREHSNTR